MRISMDETKVPKNLVAFFTERLRRALVPKMEEKCQFQMYAHQFNFWDYHLSLDLMN